MKFGQKRNMYHIPVLLNETLDFLNIKPGEKYIDATLGGGGHTRAILEKGGIVLGIDQDEEALKHVGQKPNLTLAHGNFAHLQAIATQNGFSKVSGILFDLGVSTHQLETDYRGFSFNNAGPLDMRKDPVNQAVTAADLIAAASESELARIIWEYGEDREAWKIAKAIKSSGKIKTTNELAEIILKVRHKTKGDRTHPATRTFQALRIAVNDELETLKLALEQTLNLLIPNGRLVVISFHSLEDRIVKNFLKSSSLKILTDKPVEPTPAEIAENPRSRSAKLRAAEKINQA